MVDVGDRDIDLVVAARERTLAAASARAELSIRHTVQWPVRSRRRRGGLAEPLVVAGKAAGKRLWKLARRKARLYVTGEGVVDFDGRRYMVDYGAYAQLFVEGQLWGGRSGRPISTLDPRPGDRPPPLWLFDLLAGVTHASDEGNEVVRGTTCRRFSITTDLSRASARTPGGVAAPAQPRFEDLLALQVTVWLDDAHVRRLCRSTETMIETLELWDFGVAVADLDWSRVPTFRSPDEAAEIARLMQ